MIPGQQPGLGPGGRRTRLARSPPLALCPIGRVVGAQARLGARGLALRLAQGDGRVRELLDDVLVVTGDAQGGSWPPGSGAPGAGAAGTAGGGSSFFSGG